MFARNVTLHLKADKAPEFTRKLETDVLPLLRKQPGFKDEITFLATDRDEAVAISFWDRREIAEAGTRASWPSRLTKTTAAVGGTPPSESRGVAAATSPDIGMAR